MIQKAPAAILSLGTATPKHIILQEDYSELLPHDRSFQQLCKESGIQKRHFCIGKEDIKSILSSKKSLTWRQELANTHVPELALEASNKAIASWGMPKSGITHIVFATSSGLFSPGADARLLSLLELAEDVHRIVICQQHAYAGVVALRMAKDIAENNLQARVLLVCSEIMEFSVQAPSVDPESLTNCVTLGGGAAAAIVGAPEFSSTEIPKLELHDSIETILPGDDLGTKASVDEEGMHYKFDDREVTVLCEKIPEILKDLASLSPSVVLRHELFPAVHPGSVELLSGLESGDAKLNLDASRKALTLYGDMLSASVMFILDEFLKTCGPGDGAGVVGYGPGITLNALLVTKT